ncbi:hypothetical protein NL676_003819 [Syzygium grande]|nr:hypothetical protein NL676_003819 [Syzygium grande]
MGTAGHEGDDELSVWNIGDATSDRTRGSPPHAHVAASWPVDPLGDSPPRVPQKFLEARAPSSAPQAGRRENIPAPEDHAPLERRGPIAAAARVPSLPWFFFGPIEVLRHGTRDTSSVGPSDYSGVASVVLPPCYWFFLGQDI